MKLFVRSFCSQSIKSDNKRIVVFGGNGYVGQQVVKAALLAGVDVTSINRSGAPINFKVASKSGSDAAVTWVRGDLFNADTWRHELSGATGIVSCVGSFGSNEFMEKINGDANINAISESLRSGVPKFVYVSTVENNLPNFVLSGYFNGKRRAEQALLDAFPETGVVLRPGFIYGTRDVPLPTAVHSITGPELKIPLWLIGKPLQVLFSTPPVQKLRSILPGMQAVLATPVCVENVAQVAVAAATGTLRDNSKRILSIEDIIRESRQWR